MVSYYTQSPLTATHPPAVGYPSQLPRSNGISIWIPHSEWESHLEIPQVQEANGRPQDRVEWESIETTQMQEANGRLQDQVHFERQEGLTQAAEPGSSFYNGKAKSSLHFASSKKPQEDRPRAPPELAAATEAENPPLPGDPFMAMPKRPKRDPKCLGIDKDLASCTDERAVLEEAMRRQQDMDGVNWANVLYQIANLQKRPGPRTVSFNDERWQRIWVAIRQHHEGLTGRDTANVLWSMTKINSNELDIFAKVATSLCTKLAVIDPISVSKAAWAIALGSLENRGERFRVFNQLAVQVVLRANMFPLGALSMSAYAFAKGEYRNASFYAAISCALLRYPSLDLRPVDVCNVVWAFCTVGYRDDALFDRICETQLLRREVLEQFNPQDISNTAWGFSKVGYIHEEAMAALGTEALRQQHKFKPLHFTNMLYAFANMALQGPPGLLGKLADAAMLRIADFDERHLAITVWSFSKLNEEHRILFAVADELVSPGRIGKLNSRGLSMLFLAYSRLGRLDVVDSIQQILRQHRVPLGSSGFSALLMAAEHAGSAEREIAVHEHLVEEADDPRMAIAIRNSAVLRLAKRGKKEEAVRLLCEMRESKCWDPVSTRLLLRLAPDLVRGDERQCEADGVNHANHKVSSGITPIAATRQNEERAYVREFQALQAVIHGGAPPGDPQACKDAVTKYSEDRSLWLKITAWEKGTVLHEVARHGTGPKVAVELGGYVGYSAMNMAIAVRPRGGRVVSIEVDPFHAIIARNMVEYAGLSDVVDIWIGYSYDVIPRLLDCWGPRSVGLVFMDQKGTRFHTDLGLFEELELLADDAVVLADNVLKPGAPVYIWHLCKGPYKSCTAVSVREFLLQSEDWMVMAFYDRSGKPVPKVPPELYRLAFQSDNFRKKSMFDSICPQKNEWWDFSKDFMDTLEREGTKPRVVGLHGRDNPIITPEDVAGIFQAAGRPVF